MAEREFAEIDVQLLTFLKNHRFKFNVIYDVGASDGTCSWHAANVFSEATFHLFDPLFGVQESYSAQLKRVLADRPDFILHRVALGDVSQPPRQLLRNRGRLRQHDNRRKLRAGFVRRSVAVHRLDNYVAEHRLPFPDLIKMDVQAGEVRILSAAMGCLQHASALLLETWLYREYGPKTPLLGEIVEYLREFGFDLVEFGDRYYDEKHRLASIDAMFLKRRALTERKGTLPSGDWLRSLNPR